MKSYFYTSNFVTKKNIIRLAMDKEREEENTGNAERMFKQVRDKIMQMDKKRSAHTESKDPSYRIRGCFLSV